MDVTSIWQWFIIFVLITTVANGFITKQKRRSVVGWIILGLMFNPVAFVILLLLPKS